MSMVKNARAKVIVQLGVKTENPHQIAAAVRSVLGDDVTSPVYDASDMTVRVEEITLTRTYRIGGKKKRSIDEA